MSDPFAKHGITHLSASSMSLYRNEPALWVLRYLYGFKDEVGASAWRGTAVEQAVDRLLYEATCTEEQAIALALQNFEINAQGDLSEETDKERKVIPDIVKQAAQIMRPFGIPVARQFKIEHFLDGIEVPVIGYVDYLWPDHLIDLKTTLRMPSEPRPDHAAQVAIYSAATGRKASLAYVTPKKAAVYPVEDMTQPLWTVHRSAHAVRALLTKTDTREEAAMLFSPNFDSFYWNDLSKAKAMEVFV
jgi:PD-(D/E)XK nuclease superfamily